MKILAFVDTHANKEAMSRIAGKARREKPDLVVCAGDFTVFERGLDESLFELNFLGKKVLIVHGNHESQEKVKKYSELFDNLEFIHGKAYEYDGYTIIGWGGGGFSEVNKEFENYAKRARGKKLILVTHAPPHGTKLDLLNGKHRGNKSISEFIIKKKPVLAISGHLHETAGVRDELQGTVLVNPGPEGIIIEV